MSIFVDLEQDGFGEIEHHMSHAFIQETFGTLVRTLETVPRNRLLETHHQLPIRNYSPLGYTEKEEGYKENPETGRLEWSDGKVLFQSDRKIWPNLPETRMLAREFPVLADLLDIIVTVLEGIEPHFRMIVDHYAVRYPLFREHCYRNGELAGMVIRLVLYKTRDGRVFAVLHKDKGAFTFTVGESAPGLHLQGHDGRVHTPVFSPGKSIVMTAHHSQVITRGALRATPHWVEQPVGHGLTEQFGRSSIIVFGDLAPGAMPNPSYQETHNILA